MNTVELEKRIEDLEARVKILEEVDTHGIAYEIEQLESQMKLIYFNQAVEEAVKKVFGNPVVGEVDDTYDGEQEDND